MGVEPIPPPVVRAPRPNVQEFGVPLRNRMFARWRRQNRVWHLLVRRDGVLRLGCRPNTEVPLQWLYDQDPNFVTCWRCLKLPSPALDPGVMVR